MINPKNNDKFVNKEVADHYESQRERGKEGFGVVIVDEKNKVTVHRSAIESKALLDLYMNPAKIVFMHHRQPTSTNNHKDQTHPIYVFHKDLKYNYLVMHNGVIGNNEEVRQAHKKLGIEYTTLIQEKDYNSTTRKWDKSEKFNDSECLAIELARIIEGKSNKIIAAGSAAYVVLQINKETDTLVRTMFGTNIEKDRLKFSQNRNQIRMTSEGGGMDAKNDIMYIVDMKSYKIDQLTIKIPSTIAEVDSEELKQTTEEATEENFIFSADEPLEIVLVAASEDVGDLVNDFLSEAANPECLFGESFPERVNEIRDAVYERLDKVISEATLTLSAQEDLDQEMNNQYDSYDTRTLSAQATESTKNAFSTLRKHNKRENEVGFSNKNIVNNTM